MSTDATTEPLSLKLAGALDVYAASQLHAQILQALASKRPIALDLEAVESIDTAGLQVLIMLLRSASTAEQAIKLVSTSAAITSLLQRIDNAPGGLAEVCAQA